MEVLILIPIGLAIFGWMQCFPPHQTLPTGVNGCNGYCDDYILNDESLFSSQDDDTFSTGISIDDDDMNLGSGISMNNDIFSNGCGIDPPDMVHEMMFNPAYEWCDFNIFHHDDTFSTSITTSLFSDDTFTDFSNGSSFTSFDD